MKHTHSYKKVNIGEKKPYYVFQCQDVSCTHYLPPTLILGKLSLCPRCDGIFVIEKHHLDQMVPYCNNCKTGQDDAELNP